MGRETKVGLVVGMSFIVCVAIVLSHRGDRPVVIDQAAHEIETIFSDKSVPPVLPVPRSQTVRPVAPRLEPPASRRTRTEEIPRRRHTPLPVQRPTVETQLADIHVSGAPAPGATSGAFGGLVDSWSRFTQRAAPIVAGRSRNRSEQGRPLTLTKPNRIPTQVVARNPLDDSRSAGGTEVRGDRSNGTGTPSARVAPVVVASGATYQVQPGDSLGRIAAQHYGTSAKAVLDAILAANRDTLSDADHIVVGKTLVLPALGSRFAQSDQRPSPSQAERHPEGAVASVEASRRSAPEAYVIQPGDTLGRIAARYYGTTSPETLKAIVRANRSWLASVDRIVVGKKLILPDWDATNGGSENRRSDRQASPVLAGAIPASGMGESEKPAPSAADRGREGVDWVWYQLQKGEVFSTVALKKLGTSKRWRELAELNDDIFPHPDQIRWGVKIRVPVRPGLLATALGR